MMKKIKLNVTREEDNLQNNIYYVCEKNILISQLNLTINYDENHLSDEEILEESNLKYVNHDKTKKNEEKKKNINIKISYSDELNNLYISNIINNIYDYIFEPKRYNLSINKNHSWFIFINIYIYEYTPYIYDHICNIINIHLSLLLIPFCFYDFNHKWYRCVENYEELYKLLSCNISTNDKIKEYEDKKSNSLNENQKLMGYEKDIKSEIDELESNNIIILDKNMKNKNIIINQIENNNFDLFVQIKNNRSSGLFKRLLIKCIPILTTINVNDQFVYLIKFVDYSDFFLNTKNVNDDVYNNILQKHQFVNFMKFTSFELNINNDKKFDLDDNYYMLFNANNTSIDKDNILNNSKTTIEFYYNFILNYSLKYHVDNYIK